MGLYLRSNGGTSPSPALVALARGLRDPGDTRRAALDALCVDGALHPAHAALALDRVTARYTPAALDALATRELAGRRVRVVLAASVATAPLRALALPLLRGAASVTLKPSRHQPRFARLLCPDDAPDDAPFDHLIAYGADATLTALRASLPPGVTFEGRGHGFALSVVRTTDHAAAAARVAEDVAWYDQRGCLSPQAVIVTAGDPCAFAEHLHRALAALEASLPRGPLDVGLGAAVMQWQGVQAATARRFWRGEAHAVALHDAPALGSPGARNITVAGLDDAGLLELVKRHGPRLTALGVAGPTGDLVGIDGFAGRVVAAGALQDPPLDGPEDRRPALTA